MDVGLSILAILFGIIGTIGCIIPVLPGPVLTYGGLLCLYFCSYADISPARMVIFGVLTLAVTIFDYLLPAYMAKAFGGTKAGARGAAVGTIAGIFLGAWGILLGPFIGALSGELIHDKEDRKRAFNSALGSFFAFFISTGIKFLLAVWITVVIFVNVFENIF